MAGWRSNDRQALSLPARVESAGKLEQSGFVAGLLRSELGPYSHADVRLFAGERPEHA